jgi:choline dehydrogenase-like flavoprotein
MDHHFRVGAVASIDGHEDKYIYGNRPTGFYIPRFANWEKDKRNFLRGFAYQGRSGRQNFQRNAAGLGVGAELKENLKEPGKWQIGVNGFGEILPHHDNRAYLNHKVTDKWGLPVLEINAKIRDNEKEMRKAMKTEAAEMFERIGLKNIYEYESAYEMGQGIHEMGAARMGRDPKSSVLNGHNQVWDAPNVFVTDGACMTSSSCVNPSLTYMALTARAADYAVRELKRGNL